MSDKKHIDRLFQEKLKDFERSPSDAVWNNINTQLQQSVNDKKPIPLWIKIAGVAAGLLLIFTIGNAVFNTSGTNSPETVVDTESTEQNLGQPQSIDAQDSTNSNFESTEDAITLEESEIDGHQNDELNNNAENAVTQTNTNNETNRPQRLNNVKSQNAVVESNELPLDKSAQYAQTDTKDDIVNKTKVNTSNNDSDSQNTSEIVKHAKDTNAVANTDTTTKIPELTEEPLNSTLEAEDPNEGLSLDDAIAESMEEEELEEEEEKKDFKRWSVSPHIAPVYFNSFGDGSAIDPLFNENPRSGDINMSYGVAANYHISEKLSVRGGVNKLNLGYSTNNVVVYNNIDVNVDDINPLRNVSLNEYGQALSFLSLEGAGFAQVPGVVANNIKSSIDQEFSYIEVPVELEYKLSDRKLSMSVIGGFSTLFLDENKVYTTLQGEQRLLGEATNLNETSFSANLGLGFDYKISKRIDFNLDPIFKYQINTFSDTSGDFNPYTIGFYTGFRFRF